MISQFELNSVSAFDYAVASGDTSLHTLREVFAGTKKFHLNFSHWQIKLVPAITGPHLLISNVPNSY